MQYIDDIAVFGEADERTLDQMRRCVQAEEGARGVLCADNHLGYSMPIGGVIGYREHVSPSGVGYDIACGNYCVLTDLKFEDIKQDLSQIMDVIASTISFGMGRNNDERTDHSFFDDFDDQATEFQLTFKDLAYRQLGTVGSGNHYVDLLADDQSRIWVGVHFGSRGFGHKTATHYMELAEKAGMGGGKGMDADPILIPIASDLGQDYIQAMKLAGEYAYAGREWVVDRVLSILGAESIDEVHNHHNFAWEEMHEGYKYFVVRKGATPASPGQRGFVGGSMGDISVILHGTDSDEDGFMDALTVMAQSSSLFSTVHGAGRVMSRTQAAGKVKRRKKWRNNVRDDNTDYNSREEALEGALKYRPDGGAFASRVWVEERISEGVINWDHVQEKLHSQGIELRGGGADEAPGVYKNLSSVLSAHYPTIEIEHVLRPVGVAMAGKEVKDEFRD